MKSPDRAEPVRVLFLCTHNAARSQMAEALLERRGRGRFHVASAGTEPAAIVHPLTLTVLRRAGMEWNGRRPKGLGAVLKHQPWDLAITVCDQARESCPRLPGRPIRVHWSIPDPAKVKGDEEAREVAFWDALTMLGRRIDLLCALPHEKLRDFDSRATLREIGAGADAAGTTEA